jgi:putative transposase
MQYMYINKSNKLNYRLRLNIIKAISGGWSKERIANRFEISRTTIYNIKKKYELDSVFGLEDHKTGPMKIPLNPYFYANVVENRKKYGFGACAMERYFKKKGFSVTHNKINQVLQYEGLLNKKMGKRKKPKYIRYEAENCNDQWHIDWSIDPLTKKQLFAIIDDKSRFIVFAGLFDSANAENSACALEKTIKKYGAPKEIVSDNGSHFKDIPNKKVNNELSLIEKKYGIKHVFIRPGYPQSNGKIERWFGSYKGEFPRMNYDKVKDCITWTKYYNFERLHQSLDYETPAHVYLGVNSI